MFSTLRSLVVTCVFAALGATNAQAQPAEPKIPINVGLAVFNNWPGYVARDRKILEQLGFEPKYHTFNVGGPMIAAMKGGDLDVTITGLANLFMLGQGVPMKFILTQMDASSQVNLIVRPDSGISSFRDLSKAKNIGATTATCGEVSLVRAAKTAKLNRDTLKVSNLAPNLLLTAMKGNQIDSAFIWGPWNLQLRDAGMKIINSDNDLSPIGGVCAITVAVRPAFLEKYPKAGCRLIKAHAMALADGRKNPKMAAGTMMELLGISAKHAQETFNEVDESIPTIASQIDPNGPWSMTNQTTGFAERIASAGQALYEAGSVAKPISIDVVHKATDASYIKQFVETNCN